MSAGGALSPAPMWHKGQQAGYDRCWIRGGSEGEAWRKKGGVQVDENSPRGEEKSPR